MKRVVLPLKVAQTSLPGSELVLARRLLACTGRTWTSPVAVALSLLRAIHRGMGENNPRTLDFLFRQEVQAEGC